MAAKKGGRKDGARRDRTDAASLATKERHAEWIGLRRKGHNYRAIAEQYGVAANAPRPSKQAGLIFDETEPSE